MLVTFALIMIVWLVAGVGLAWILGRSADLGSADDVRLQEDLSHHAHVDLAPDLAPLHNSHR